MSLSGDFARVNTLLPLSNNWRLHLHHWQRLDIYRCSVRLLCFFVQDHSLFTEASGLGRLIRGRLCLLASLLLMIPKAPY